MAVAYDNQSTLALGTGDRSWTHTPTGTPAGALVLIVEEGGTDTILGVTYGGQAMSEVALSPVLYAGAESGSVHGYFLNKPTDTNAATVAIDTDTGSDQYIAACFTVTSATGESEVHDTSAMAGAASQTTVGATLTITKDSFVAGVMYSGLAAPAFTEVTGTTEVIEADLGQDSGGISRGSSIKTGNFAYTWTQASDDGMALVVAICEALATTTYTFTDKKADAVVRKSQSVTSTTGNAVLLATITNAVKTLDAVKRWNVSDDVLVDAFLLRLGSGTATADAIRKGTITGQASLDSVTLRALTASVLADAFFNLVNTGQVTVDAVRGATIDEQALLDAIVRAIRSAAITSDAILFKTVEFPAGFTIDALVPSESTTVTADFGAYSESSLVGRCIWTSPPDGDPVGFTPELKFLMPSSHAEMYFWLELDRVNTFDGADLRQYVTTVSQTGWAYWDGNSWETVTGAGVSNTYAGNEARFTLSVPLTGGTWYRRVRAGTR
jgi:hypothetical protein